VFGAIALDDGAEGVFEEFEADVGEVAGDVRECEVFGADELDGGAFEHCVMLFADEAGVFDGFEDDVVDVLVGRGESVGSEIITIIIIIVGRRTAFVQMMPT
jgi:hypothetical protein